MSKSYFRWESQVRAALVMAVFFLIVVSAVSAIPTFSYAITNFDTPILTPAQTRYNEPWVGTIIYLYAYTTHTDEYNALIAGKIDFATLDHADQIRTLLTQYNNTVYTAIAPVESFGQLVFAFGNNLTANINFRYAISSLINTTEVTTYVLDDGLLGTDYPYYVSPTIYKEWFNPAVVAYYNQYESYNLTRAAKYLSMVPGVTHVDGKWLYNGVPLKLTFLYPSGDTPAQKLANILQEAASEINLSITPVQTTFGTLITDATTPPYNDFNITSFGWISLGPFPNSWLGAIYSSPTNTGGFSNSTVAQLYQKSFNAPTLAQAINETKQLEYVLQVEEPYVIFVWSNAIQGVYLPGWANYIYMNKGTPVYAVNIMDVHPINSALNGTFIFSSVSSDTPRHQNPYASVSLYAANSLDDMYDSLGISPLNNPTQISPWIASNWTYDEFINTTLPNGDKLVNGSILTVNLVHNDTWIDGVPVTAYDVNFTVWYYDLAGMMGVNTFDGLTVNYTYLVDQGFINSDVFGEIPSLVWTKVTSPYQIVFYFNSSSYLDEFYALTGYIIMPWHVYGSLPPQVLFQEKIAPLISSGPYMFSTWNVPAQEIVVTANPHYFRIDPAIFPYAVVSGSPFTYTTNFTYYTWNYNTNDSLIANPVNGATAYLYLKYLNVSGEPYGNVTVNGAQLITTMTQVSPGVYRGTLSTTGLQPGVYEVVAKAVWTVNGQQRMEYSYAELTVGALKLSTNVVTTPSAMLTATIEGQNVSVNQVMLNGVPVTYTTQTTSNGVNVVVPFNASSEADGPYTLTVDYTISGVPSSSTLTFSNNYHFATLQNETAQLSSEIASLHNSISSVQSSVSTAFTVGIIGIVVAIIAIIVAALSLRRR
jgi:ABC-type dipeptide transport system, periplasmic component